jgi:hypothetical protein
MKPISRETILERRQPVMRWSAVFAGGMLAIGLWILLQTLGMGLGLSVIDTDDAGNLKGIGIGTGIWSLIAPLIAIFLGAWLAGRMSGSREGRVGAMHGSVVWALSTAVGLWAMFSVVSSLASGAMKVGGAAVNATTSVVSGAASAAGGGRAGGVAQAIGLDASDLVAPINERLQQQGKPPITADQLQATMRAVAQRGVREGQLDRQVVVEELARNTSLSQADAQDVANQVEQKYKELSAKASNTAGQVAETAKHTALEAADKTGKALLFGGIMMLLNLGAAIGGGFVGGRGGRRDRELDVRERELRDRELRERELRDRELQRERGEIVAPTTRTVVEPTRP